MTNNIHLCATLELECWSSLLVQDLPLVLVLHLHEYTAVN